MLSKVFKAYDVRALYPNPLNERIAWQIGHATAEYILGYATQHGAGTPMAKHIVVGRDMRKSSPALSTALIDGMRAYGANVIDVGLVDTPFVYFAINHLGTAGGVQVTASHNPANYNGFKVSKLAAKPVGADTGLNEIQRLAALVDPDKVASKGGTRESRDLWKPYREHLLRFLAPEVVNGGRPMKVVIDASNGMAGTMVPKVFQDPSARISGLSIVPINFDNSTGEFVHEPNPLVESNLAQVRAGVKEHKADFGVCFDGDADRCMVIDERGEPVGCDILLAALVKDALAGMPKGTAVVYDLRSSRSVAEAIREAGGTPVESRVGHVFMKAKLAEAKAPIGGELSGHFYFGDMFGTDSGARAFVAVLTALSHAKKPLSQLVAPFQRYVQSGEINFENADKEGAIASLKKAYPHAKVTELDGVSLDVGSWWCNVRMSNTEPLLRLNLEAKDKATVDKAVADVSAMLGKRVDH